jgi:hypothetical protein
MLETSACCCAVCAKDTTDRSRIVTKAPKLARKGDGITLFIFIFSEGKGKGIFANNNTLRLKRLVSMSQAQCPNVGCSHGLSGCAHAMPRFRWIEGSPVPVRSLGIHLMPGIDRRALNAATAKLSTRAALFAVWCMPSLDSAAARRKVSRRKR